MDLSSHVAGRAGAVTVGNPEAIALGKSGRTTGGQGKRGGRRSGAPRSAAQPPPRWPGLSGLVLSWFFPEDEAAAAKVIFTSVYHEIEAPADNRSQEFAPEHSIA